MAGAAALQNRRQAFLRAIATATPGLNVQRALDTRGSDSVAAQLTRAHRSADRLHVSSTPSFFLLRPGRAPVRLRPSALTTQGLSSAIEAAL
jgi:hypothetical protein